MINDNDIYKSQFTIIFFPIQVRTLHTVLSILEAAVDFFSRYENVDKILELAMITVSEEFSGRGVGRRLVQVKLRCYFPVNLMLSGFLVHIS